MTPGSTRTRWTLAVLVAGLLLITGTVVAVHVISARHRVINGAAGASPKKGVGTWQFHGVADGLVGTRVSWYYNWKPAPSVDRLRGVRFVPMAWGAASVTKANLTKARAAGDTLLTFNEPDRVDQANMSVSQALDLWPTLMATGLRLGSPSPSADGATPGSWLDQFMQAAKERAYRVDFIAVHWYGSDFDSTAVVQLQNYLQSVHDRYELPIWLTEFALIDFPKETPDLAHASYPTDAQQAQFIGAATTMLEQLPYVQEYAWFALPPLTNVAGSGLCRTDGTLTAAGQAYRTVS